MAENFGRVVRSLKGRDKGRLLVIVETEQQNYFLCDGKERPIERPKLKNAKHLEFTQWVLDADSVTTNRKLRRALHGLDEEVK